jgi:hypothetical protein
MTEAKLTWSIWQVLLNAFAWAFTRPGFRRFIAWITALALNLGEHTITQSDSAIERLADWKAVETFAEYGAWRPASVTRSSVRLVEQAPGRVWHAYHVSTVDDTKVHRSGEHVRGSCTFHAGAQLGSPRGAATELRPACLVPAPLWSARLPQVASQIHPGRALGLRALDPVEQRRTTARGQNRR